MFNKLKQFECLQQAYKIHLIQLITDAFVMRKFWNDNNYFTFHHSEINECFKI